jgi:hypothetical protein
MKGKKPSSGTVTIVNGKVTSATNLCFNDYSVDYDGKKATVKSGCNGSSNPEPVVQEEPICKRATSLHSEICNNTDTSAYCSASGEVGNGNEITYGSIGTGNTLTAGEALDCKVSSSGDYTERFYYMTDLESDSDYAVLLYSQDTSNGTVAYGPNSYSGPQTAVSSLPTISTWDNIELAESTRQLYATSDLTSYATTINNGSITLGTFSYAGYAGRLLTIKELKEACSSASGITGSLANCKYLLENTKYGDSTRSNYGYWLETTHASGNIWTLYGNSRRLSNSNASNSNIHGVRPAIEVPKSRIKLD